MKGSEPMDFETELRARLRAGADAADTDLHVLVEGGLRSGRRFARRRMLTRLVAATAGSALVIGAVAWSGVLTRPDGSGNVATTPSVAAAKVPITPEAAQRILRGLLPKGKYTNGPVSWMETSTQPPKRIGILAGVRRDSSPDRSRLTLTMTTAPFDGSCMSQPDEATCDWVTWPDGSRISVEYVFSEDSVPTEKSMTIVRTDGVRIRLSESTENDKPLTAPLTSEQATQILRSPAWQPKVDPGK